MIKTTKENRSAETDYLIVGAGAMGMAFADEVFERKQDVKITLVDRRVKPGGHWNDAYPFVGLHQPAAFYGVNSLTLGNGSEDLSSKQEILSYYEKVMDKFKASGRVEFLSQHNYIGNRQVVAMQHPERIIEYKVNKRVVDATYMDVEIPATHPPKFSFEEGVPLVPLNELVNEYNRWEQFCVIGGGKTGMDAILFLLNKGVAAGRIYWIVPNDAWLFNREYMQIGKVVGELLTHAEHLKHARKADDVFLEMEKSGGIFRLDKNNLPTKWRCATVSPGELKQLHSLKNVIRKGRVKHITTTEIQLESGNVPYLKKTLFVNCTANGLAQLPKKLIFSEGLITLQSVFFCQAVFSAAAIARLELTRLSDKTRNKIKPVQHPENKEDWPFVYTGTIDNLLLFNRYLPLWMYNSRLNFMSYETTWRYLGYGIKAVLLALPVKKAVKKMERKIGAS